MMAVLCFLLNEPQNFGGFAIAFVISAIIAMALKILFPRSEELELRHAMVLAAIAYLLVPAVSAIPFVIIEHMSLLDAMFEAISGWTGTGFSMIMVPENSSHIIQLWRSVTQWIGGIGVILLMVTILIRPGTSTYIMYQSEARKDRIRPSIRSTIKAIWLLYVLLTIIGILGLMIVGMPLWDSLNHCMVAIGTGGFSIYSDSIAHYNSVPIEIVLMAIMFAGALPFAFVYKIIKSPKSIWPLDSQVYTYIVIFIVGIAFLALENFLLFHDWIMSLRLSAFQFVSGVTSTGLQTSNMAGWSPTALLILSIAMIIGGCAGSTAGGIKVARAIFLTDEVRVWLKRTVLPRTALVMVNVGNKRVSEDVLNKELAEATLISFLWIVTIMVSVMALSHLVSPTYDLSHVIFTVCSAQGNAGLWCGIVDPGMHYLGKIILIIDMWIGRLEIIPVTLLIRYLIKGFRI
jgi:trk system potassium uptake protein TrkH